MERALRPRRPERRVRRRLERRAHSDATCRAPTGSGATPLSLPDASLLSLSSTGELAVSLGHAFDGWMGEGTLARAPILSGAPRAMVEHVREADWAPDGSDLAIVRRVGAMERLEFPLGKVLYQTPATSRTSASRATGSASPLPIIRSTATTTATSPSSTSQGRRTTLATGFQGLRGVCWSPDDTEVWFTAGSNAPYAGVVAQGVDARRAAVRTLLSLPTDWRMLDVANDGRALMSSELVVRQIEVVREDDPQPQDVTLFEQSTAAPSRATAARC